MKLLKYTIIILLSTFQISFSLFDGGLQIPLYQFGGIIPHLQTNNYSLIRGVIGENFLGTQTYSIENNKGIINIGFFYGLNGVFPYPSLRIIDINEKYIFPLTLVGYEPSHQTFAIENISYQTVKIDSVILSGVILDSTNVLQEFFVAEKPEELKPTEKKNLIIEFFPGGKGDDPYGVQGIRHSTMRIFINGNPNPAIVYNIFGEAVLAYAVNDSTSVPIQFAYHGFLAYDKNNKIINIPEENAKLRFGIYDATTKKLASEVKFVYDTTYPQEFWPRGKISVDKNTGVFEYIPNDLDRYPFEVEVTLNGTIIKDTFQIVPYKILPPSTIKYGVRKTEYTNLPDEADIRRFGFIGSFPSGSKRKQEYTDLETRNQLIVGKSIEIINGTVNKTFDLNANDIDTLFIIGETVNIIGELKTPGAFLNIKARNLIIHPNTVVRTKYIAEDKDTLFGKYIIHCGNLNVLNNKALSSFFELNKDSTNLDTIYTRTGDELPIWFNSSLLRTIYSFASECYLEGYIEFTDSLVTEYIELFDNYFRTGIYETLNDAQKADIENIIERLSLISSRIHTNLDYFGNLFGWTPSLGIKAQMASYDTELKYAMSSIYISRLLQKIEKNVERKQIILEKAIQRFDEMIEELRKEHEQIREEIRSLRVQADSVQSLFDRTKLEFDALTKALEKRANQILAERERERAEEAKKAAKKAKKRKLRGALINVALLAATFSPVGQPALAMAAKIARTALATREAMRGFNFKKPFSMENFDKIQKGVLKAQETWNSPGFTNVRELIGTANQLASGLGIENRLTRASNTIEGMMKDFESIKNNFDKFQNQDKKDFSLLKKIFDDSKKLIDSGKALKNQAKEVKQLFDDSKIKDKLKLALQEIVPNEPKPIIPRLPDGELGLILSELQSKDPSYLSLLNKVNELNYELHFLTNEIAIRVKRSAEIPIEISNSFLASINLNLEKQGVQLAFDGLAFNYIYDLEQRAREELLKNSYYIARSYEYTYLKQYPGKINTLYDGDRLYRTLDSLANRSLTPNGVNPLDNLAIWKEMEVVYKDQLIELGRRIKELANKGQLPSWSKRSFFYKLDSIELSKLNTPDLQNNEKSVIINFDKSKRIPINAIGARIQSINLKNVSYKSNLNYNDNETIEFKYSYLGEGSLIGTDNEYSFYFYPRNNPNPVIWESTFNLKSKSIKNSTPNRDQNDILSYLLGYSSKDGKEKDYFEKLPLIGNIKINVTKDGSFIKLDSMIAELELEIEYHTSNEITNQKWLRIDALPVSANHHKNGLIIPYFSIKRENGNFEDSRGVVRKFLHNNEKLEVFAPKKYGQWIFSHWSLPDGQLPSNLIVDNPFSNQIRITIRENTDLVARYIPPIIEGKIKIDTSQSKNKKLALLFMGKFADGEERDSTRSKPIIWAINKKKSENLKNGITIGEKDGILDFENAQLLDSDTIKIIIEAEYAINEQYVLVEYPITLTKNAISAINSNFTETRRGSFLYNYAYPNPTTSGLINISFASLQSGDVKLSIYNFSGKLVYDKDFYTSEYVNKLVTIPTSQFSKGVYFYILKQNNLIEHNSFIVD